MPPLLKTALVTGAARGIGLAIASRLAADGMRVALLDLDPAVTEAAARTVGGEVLALSADVTKGADVDAAVGRVVDHWGRLDVLVNNAGITGRSFPIWELTDEDWQRVIDVDLTSVFLCCRAAVRVMLAQGSGRIVNIASIAGKEGNPTLVPYSSAKAGVIGLTKALAKEVATRGILVNAVAPAVIGTELLKQMEQSTVDLLVSKIPMGRVGSPARGRRAGGLARLGRVLVQHGRRLRSLRRPRHVLAQDAEKGPSASLAPSAARSTYREYASRAAGAPPRIWTFLSILRRFREAPCWPRLGQRLHAGCHLIQTDFTFTNSRIPYSESSRP